MPHRTITLANDAYPNVHAGRVVRTSVMLMATIEPNGRTASQHRVRDVSSGGLRVDNAAGLQAGAQVLVSVGAIEAEEATIVWVRGTFAGLAFTAQIEPDDARKKARVAPAPVKAAPEKLFKAAPVPTAGWMSEMRDPYKK
jgi:hypothetical protein